MRTERENSLTGRALARDTTTLVDAAAPLALLIGVVCKEAKPELRSKLRRLYSQLPKIVAAKFVLDAAWVAAQLS